ncbi:hypothetical protein PG996_009987 [Apiospora saccharicola]|uniref:F-box domain-containing protein n=1 Tax=Apiospora saccharicola TaxID=335842 RepID=A0ABR1UMC5_9PEZI
MLRGHKSSDVVLSSKKLQQHVLSSTEGDAGTTTSGQQQQPSRGGGAAAVSLATLPPEIHHLIAQQLIYPDALSLKHTCRYFYSLVNTGVRLKVEWLVQRRMLHLECPNDKRCDLGSDLKFCRGSVPLLMQRRREHMECESRPGLGCLVFGTPSCAHRPQLQRRWGKWLRLQLTVELWWVLLALAPLVLGSVWMLEVAAWVRRA